MKITKVNDAPLRKTVHKGIEPRALYDHDTAQVTHLKFNPGDSLKPHITPVDVFFYVLEGTPDILIGEERVTVEKDSLVESPKNIVHCIYNDKSDTVARVLVVKAPKPTSATKVVSE